MFSRRKRIGRGRFGNVYLATVPSSPDPLAVKLMDRPTSIYDHCVLYDVYTEVAIMEQLRFCEGVCRIVDYGVSKESYWLVMKHYPLSLKQWRIQQTTPQANRANKLESSTIPPGPSFSAQQLRAYFDIFRQILRACHSLSKKHVAHFDIKCDNVLVAPLEDGASTQAQHGSGFTVCLGDFGESAIGRETSACALSLD